MADGALSLGIDGEMVVVTAGQPGAEGVARLTAEEATAYAERLDALAREIRRAVAVRAGAEPGPTPEQWAFRPSAETGTEGATDEDIAAARAEYAEDYARLQEKYGVVRSDATSPTHLVVQHYMRIRQERERGQEKATGRGG